MVLPSYDTLNWWAASMTDSITATNHTSSLSIFMMRTKSRIVAGKLIKTYVDPTSSQFRVDFVQFFT